MFPKQFYSFWISKTSMTLANVLYIMVITTYIYERTGSATYAALFPLFQMVSSLFAGFLTPILIERISFKKLIVTLPFIKNGLLILLAFNFNELINEIGLLLVIIFFIALAQGFETPLINSIVPKMVKQQILAKANSWLSLSDQTVSMIGYVFTGYLVVTFGGQPVLIVMSFIVVASLFTLIHALTLIEQEPILKPSKSKWAAVKEGWGLLWQNRSLRLITAMDIIEGIAGAIWIGAMTLIYVQEALGKTEAWWGYINGSYFGGTIIGGLLAVAIAGTIQKNLIKSMAFGSLIFSCLTLWYGLNSTPFIALILCVLMGPSYQIRDIAQKTALQSSVSDQLLPKVFATHGILTSIAMTLSILMVGLVADFIGIRWVYIIGSGFIFISVFLSLALMKVRSTQKLVQNT